MATENAVGRPPEANGRPGRARMAWRGARTGFRLTSSIAAPIAAVIAMVAAVPTAIGLGARRGFGIHPVALEAAGLDLLFAGCGLIVGGVAGLVLGSDPARADSPPAGDRPIRLRFWRKAEAARPVRRRRRWRWALGGLTCVVFVAAYGIGVYLGRLVDGRLAAATAEADRDDPNWRLDDLMAHREPVPDEENSALVVGEVLAQLPERWPSPPAEAPGLPSPPTEVKLAYDRAVEAVGNLRLDAATVDTLGRELDDYEDAVKLARTVADFARGRHELIVGPTVIDTLLPETEGARTPARLLAADAAVRAHDGDLDGALDSCRAILGVGRSIGDEPFAISQLVRQAIGSLGLRSACRVLGQGEPSDASLARLQALILDEKGAPLLLHAMRGERASLVELIRRIGSGELPISALSDRDVRSAVGGDQVAIAPWGRLLFDHQRALALEWLNQALVVARRPPAEQPPGWKAWEDELHRVRLSRTGVYTSTFPLLMMPALSSVFWARQRHQSELGATALLIAAERHRRKTGAWPASAEAIDPAILANPPVDPCSGRPFIFDRRDGRLIIHSVGPNLRDEHGAYEARRWNNGGPDDVGATAWDVTLRRQTPP